MGEGTKRIIDTISDLGLDKVVVSVDPYGSIKYICREPDGPCRLDYTEEMMHDCCGLMHPYAKSKNVKWRFFPLEDVEYFSVFANGLPLYDLEKRYENRYSMVHFDGPHSVAQILTEVEFFNERTPSGAVYVFDDAIPEFYDHEQVHAVLINTGWELVKQGVKKAMYRKI